MRQTSRAVALLLVLESAQAAANAIVANSLAVAAFTTVDIINNYNAAASVTPSNALTNRQASYSQVMGLWKWNALVIKQTLWPVGAAYAGTASTTVGSGCMGCLNQKGVWCSRSYAYLTTAAAGLQNDVTAAAGFMNVDASPSNSKRLGGAALDGGSCCASTWQMNQVMGSISVPGVLPSYDATTTVYTGLDITTSGTGTVAPYMTLISCVAANNAAITDTATGSWGVMAWDVTYTQWSSWWCSNGLYKQVTGNSASGIQANFNQQIASNTNKRQELAQVACPQVDTFCGYGVTPTSGTAGPATVGSDITAGAVSFTVAGTSTDSLLKYVGKCTWVAFAYALAPTFAVSQGSTYTSGLSSNWELHTMEYVTATATSSGRLLEQSSSTGYNSASAADSVNQGNFIPLFQMPAAAFAGLRTWYGAGSFDLVGTEPANWYAPGQNAAGANVIPTDNAMSLQLATASTQYYGNVANFPQSTFYSSATASQVVPSGSTYGKAGTTKFDLRQVRFLPASAAQNVWAAGNTINTTYSTAVTNYTTAKGVWDAYVAILTANGKQDAFAAMFSPPKAPTVPPLPNMPWTPPAYSGYTVVDTALKSAMRFNGLATADFTSTAQPTSGGFWTNQAAALSAGGWGTFTAQILSFRQNFGKSFGTIGFSGDTKKELMSQVWNMPWMCTAADTAALQISTGACQLTYTPGTNGATGNSATTGTNLSLAASTGGRLVVVVSLWSKGDALQSGSVAASSGFTTASQELKITFTPNIWSTELQALAAITAPGAPAAAATLSGIAGAQALAASTAAALAVAAALY